MANQTYVRDPAYTTFTDHPDTWPVSWPTDAMLAAIPRNNDAFEFPQKVNLLLRYTPVEEPFMAGPYFSLAALQVTQK
jgi:hypothetical protein